MGDNVDIDLYQDFGDSEQVHNDEYDGDVDLYDDVMTTTNNINNNDNNIPSEHPDVETNGSYNNNMNHIARRHQLYIGNLTWWTTDQDITDAVMSIGVNDFQEVKFFENRANGQSKGFCVITLGSENSMRIVMENLSKKELNGQNPVVTMPTKQALNQFESQQKTRPTPPAPTNNQKSPGMGMNSVPMQGPGMPPQGMRMMNPNGPPMRGPMPNMQQGGPNMGPGMQRMQGPPMHPPMNQQGMPPRFQNQWNGPRGGPNGMNRPGMGPPMGLNPRPQMMPGPPRGPPRPDWNRPPMHPGNYQGQGGNMPPHHMPPRGPVNMPPNNHPQNSGPPIQGPAPHVNPAFFNQNSMPPQGHPQGPPMGQQNMPHFNQQGRGMWQNVPNKMPNASNNFVEATQNAPPQISETEFEEIMGRNRTVSSSAIARAVSDAAASEYASAIETLATAISLIKQSKVANDERCKILINSLQDTLQGIETKSYNRRDRTDRSRSRERRRRRERSNSRSYRGRSRSREHREHRERERDGGRYYGSSENYHGRERSRSRERGANEHYRDESNSRRPRNKSTEPAGESVVDGNSKRFYDDRYRERDRERSERGERRERDETRARH